MNTRAETVRLRRAGRIPAETVAYLNSRKPDGGLIYPPDRWMRWLAEIVVLVLLYAVLSDRHASQSFMAVVLVTAWTVLRTVYRILQMGYRSWLKRSDSAH